jgi:hypothetical protein
VLNSDKPTNQSLVLEASNLPKHQLRIPTCYAAISIDGGPVEKTGDQKGTSVKWSDSSFDLYVSIVDEARSLSLANLSERTTQ